VVAASMLQTLLAPRSGFGAAFVPSAGLAPAMLFAIATGQVDAQRQTHFVWRQDAHAVR